MEGMREGSKTKGLARISKPAKWEKGRVVGGEEDRPTLLKITGTEGQITM